MKKVINQKLINFYQDRNSQELFDTSGGGRIAVQHDETIVWSKPDKQIANLDMSPKITKTVPKVTNGVIDYDVYFYGGEVPETPDNLQFDDLEDNWIKQ